MHDGPRYRRKRAPQHIPGCPRVKQQLRLNRIRDNVGALALRLDPNLLEQCEKLLLPVAHRCLINLRVSHETCDRRGLAWHAARVRMVDTLARAGVGHPDGQRRGQLGAR